MADEKQKVTTMETEKSSQLSPQPPLPPDDVKLTVYLQESVREGKDQDKRDS